MITSPICTSFFESVLYFVDWLRFLLIFNSWHCYFHDPQNLIVQSLYNSIFCFFVICWICFNWSFINHNWLQYFLYDVFNYVFNIFCKMKINIVIYKYFFLILFIQTIFFIFNNNWSNSEKKNFKKWMFSFNILNQNKILFCCV